MLSCNIFYSVSPGSIKQMTTCVVVVVVCQMFNSAYINSARGIRIKYVMTKIIITVKNDYLCLVILYLYAFKQITTPRYCLYAASLIYIIQYIWYKYET